MQHRIFLVWLLLYGLGLGSNVHAAVLHDESVQGDLSGDRLNPTPHTLASGTNSVIAASDPFDLEYLTLTVPSGRVLSQIVLEDFSGESFVSFIGVERGATMSVTPAATTAAGLLGWAHFSAVGSDLLGIMGASGLGAEGFVPPLPAGAYAFWIQEFDAPVQYRLDFNVSAVPELSQWAMMSIGLIALAALRRNAAAGAGANGWRVSLACGRVHTHRLDRHVRAKDIRWVHLGTVPGGAPVDRVAYCLIWLCGTITPDLAHSAFGVRLTRACSGDDSRDDTSVMTSSLRSAIVRTAIWQRTLP